MVRTSKNSFCGSLSSEQNTVLRPAGARCTQSGIFFDESTFFTETLKLFFWFEPLKSRFEVACVVRRTGFHARRAHGGHEAGYFLLSHLFFLDG